MSPELQTIDCVPGQIMYNCFYIGTMLWDPCLMPPPPSSLYPGQHHAYWTTLVALEDGQVVIKCHQHHQSLLYCIILYAFLWFSMWDEFFSPRVSESYRSHLWPGWDSETISHGKPYNMHYLDYFTFKASWKPCEMGLSHNCFFIWGKVRSMREKSFSQMSYPRGDVYIHLI